MIYFKKRLNVTLFHRIIVTIIGVIISLFIGGIIFILNKKNPFEIYYSMFIYVFGSKYGLFETLLTSIPLILCGLAISLTGTIKVWNIGAEGQYVFGALGAGVVGIYFSFLPPQILIPFMVLSGIILSGFLASIPAILKIFFQVNEILVTLMLNYVSILFLSFLLYGPLKGKDNFPYSEYIGEAVRLPTILNTRLNIAIFFAIFLAILLHYILNKTVFGYELKVIGESYKASKYAGININRNIFIVFLLSGMIAGIGGVFDLMGLQYRLQPSISQGYGFTGIIVSWLSKNNMITVLLVSFLVSILYVGCNDLQISFNIPFSIIKLFQGIVFISILSVEIFKEYRIVFKNRI